MNDKKKKLVVRVLAILLAAGMIFGICAAAVRAEVDMGSSYSVGSDAWPGWKPGPQITGQTACLMDFETGEILYDKGMDAQRYPASITKIMTAMIVLDHCPDMNAMVTFTQTGLNDAFAGSANIGPTVGEQLTVEQMLKLCLVKSANDVSTQLAEYVGGSVQNFVQMMNDKAAELGCTNTHFCNANGLENNDHYTSAHDMAIIARAAYRYDKFREIIINQNVYIPATNIGPERAYQGHMSMVDPSSPYYYEGCTGGKTGYTDISLCTLVGYACRNDRILVGVTMAVPGTEYSFQDMAQMFDYGFNNFTNVNAAGNYQMVSGGSIVCPSNMDPSLISVLPSSGGIPGEVDFYIGDRYVDSGTMTPEAFQQLQNDLNPEALAQAAQSAEEVTTAQADAAAKETKKETKKKSSKMILYIIIVVLIAAIVTCVISIFVGQRRIKSINGRGEDR